MAPAVLMMFFGSGWDVLASGVGMNENLAIACGLGAFLALERRALASDLLAGSLVMAGLASFSGEFAIALGCTVLIVAEGRWRRIWVMIVPILLFGIWDAQAAQGVGAARVTSDHLGALPYSMFNSVSAAMAGASGAFPTGFPSGLPSIDLSVGRPLAAVAIAGLGYLLLSGRRVTPRFLAYVTVVVAFWALIGSVGRDPSLGRYNLEALPFVFLALFELVAGHRLRRWQWAVVGVVLGFALLANVVALRNGAAILRYHGAADRATIAALELQPRRVEANPTLNDTSISHLAGFSDPTQSDLIYITPSEYLRAAEEFGSAAYPPADIVTAPEYARESADRLLFRVLGIEARPISPDAAARRGGWCTTLRPVAAGSPSIEIPPSGLTLRTSTSGAQLELRRFADVSTITPLVVPARSMRALSIPGDSLSRPWTADVSSSTPVIACSAARDRSA